MAFKSNAPIGIKARGISVLCAHKRCGCGKAYEKTPRRVSCGHFREHFRATARGRAGGVVQVWFAVEAAPSEPGAG
jgi:hypothetical protein